MQQNPKELASKKVYCPSTVELKYPVELIGESSDIVSAHFPVNYLRPFFEGVARVAETITIGVGNDVPLEVLFEGEGISGKYLLAPRIVSN